MASDPVQERNAANARFSTGPRTDAGKTISSGNAEVHGFCSAEPRNPEDRAEADWIYALLARELKPVTPMELAAVREAANADQRRRRIGRALDDLALESADRRGVDRRFRLADDHDRCRSEVRFWTMIQEEPPTLGRGLDADVLHAVLARFGADLDGLGVDRDSRANLVRFYQGRIQGGDTLARALVVRNRGVKKLDESLEREIRKAERGVEEMLTLVRECLKKANDALAEASRRVAENQAGPRRADDWFDDSKRSQLLYRYQAEADRAYFRALRSLDAVRRRRDAERREQDRLDRKARQAARQAEIDARAKPQRNEMVDRVVEPLVARTTAPNEPRSTDPAAKPTMNPQVPSNPPAAPAAPDAPRVVHRRGKAVVIPPRRPPNRR